MNKILISIVTITILALWSCTEVDEPKIDNPYDPQYESTVKPKATLTEGPSSNSEITETSASFSWSGTGGSSSEFAYMLQGVDEDFSRWTSRTSKTYDYLDEGTYTFLIKERFPNNSEQSDATSTSFTVNAIQEFGLILEKMDIEADNGENFSINLNVEEADDLNGFTTVISYDPNLLTFVSATENTVDDIESIGVLYKEIGTGQIEINVLLLGTTSGFSGNASLCQLNFNSQSDNSSEITFVESYTDMRDDNNRVIDINTYRSATVNR